MTDVLVAPETLRSPLARAALGPTVAATAGLLGGFGLGQATSNRQVAGALFAVAGAWAVRGWVRRAGGAPAAALAAGYVAAMGLAHPLAKAVGPWPAVLGVTAAVAAASEAVTRRPH